MITLTGQLWIDGQWQEGLDRSWTSQNPFRLELLWNGRWANGEQIELAIQAANRAASAWARASLQDRIDVAKRFAQVLESQRKPLQLLITRETGKPLWESDTEISTSIQKVQNSIDALLQRRWSTTEGTGDSISVIRYRPLGTMLVLGPFNLPLHLPGAHIVPALLAGNTVVFKPSEQTPAVGEFLVRCWQAAGIPQGVLNLIQGAGDVAQAAVASPSVHGVLFTGSYRAGRAIHQATAGSPEKLLALEMGGNNAMVIDHTRSIDGAVYQVILSSFITSGQRCTCARRLIITREGNGRDVMCRLIEVLDRIRVGDPEGLPAPFMGSLVSKVAADQCLQGQEHWLSRFATPIRPMVAHPQHPTVLHPGIIQAVAEELPDGELFGPLLVLQEAEDLEEAVFLANSTRYGLAASLISDQVESFQYFVHHVNAGIVNWNRQSTGASGKLPFGGVGWSGNFRPSGFYAADYCSYPVASLESHHVQVPTTLNPGLESVFEHAQ
jgi:succinylglutamic semialdehyde dehydrogenase